MAYIWADAAGGLPAHAPPAPLRSCLGVLALLVAFMWPLDDLAAHWSLLALVLQRLLLMLAVPPLLVTGTPRPIIVRLTRPAAVDAILRVVVKPVPAVAIVTVVAVGTLTTGLVSLAAHSDVARVVDPDRRAAVGLRPVGAGAHRAARERSPSRPSAGAAT